MSRLSWNEIEQEIFETARESDLDANLPTVSDPAKGGSVLTGSGSPSKFVRRFAVPDSTEPLRVVERVMSIGAAHVDKSAGLYRRISGR